MVYRNVKKVWFLLKRTQKSKKLFIKRKNIHLLYGFNK